MTTDGLHFEKWIVRISPLSTFIERRMIGDIQWRVLSNTLRQVWVSQKQPPERNQIGVTLREVQACPLAVKASIGDRGWYAQTISRSFRAHVTRRLYGFLV